MARIAPVTRDAIPQDERAAYDAFSANRGSEPKIGPYSILAHMPEMAQRLAITRWAPSPAPPRFVRRELDGWDYADRLRGSS